MNNIDIPYIVNQMASLDLRFWRVKGMQGNILGYNLDPNTDMEKSKAALSDLMKRCNGTIEVNLLKTAGKSLTSPADITHYYNCDQVTASTSSGITGNIMPSGVISIEEHQRAINAAVENATLKHRIETLEKGDAITEVTKALAPYLPMMFGSPPANIASAPPINGDNGILQTEDVFIQRINGAVNRLMQKDDTLPETLEALAWYAENRSEEYNSYLGMLKAQYRSNGGK